MSWTESFPVLDEAMVEEFEELASAEDKATLEEWYGVDRVFNAQDKRHILALSLFWKPSAASAVTYPTPSKEVLKNASKLGLKLRFEPWEHYIQPVLEGVPKILKEHDDVVVRVYLAADLEFLVPDLIDAGCEVFLMRHPSIAHAPGVAWRVLAFSEVGRLVTMVDADRMNGVSEDIARTKAMERAGLAAWRSPVPIDRDGQGNVAYRAFMGAQIGCHGGWPIELLLHAFTWHTLRKTIPTMVDLPGCGLLPIGYGSWPNYGFEEWFLTVALYPRIAGGGLLTFVPAGAKCTLLTLDIEYAMWANSESQLIYFPVGDCCAPASQKKSDSSQPKIVLVSKVEAGAVPQA